MRVEDLLGTYRIRKKIQEQGINNPSEEIKKFTRDLVEKLEQMPLEEEVKIENYSFIDSKREYNCDCSRKITLSSLPIIRWMTQ